MNKLTYEEMAENERQLGFQSMDNFGEQNKKFSTKYHNNSLKFGINYLDKSLRGIEMDDFVLVGALPGLGKTELATFFALENARAGKKVHFFALEASHLEIQRRMQFKLVMQAFKKAYPERPVFRYNFYDWIRGSFDELTQFEKDAVDEIQSYRNLKIFYRENTFTPEQFKHKVLALQGNSDLVIVDHLHYFDLDDDNENKAVGDAMKTMRDLVLINQTPIILIAHLRKQHKQFKPLVPDLDDFHGSSNIGKIATKAVILAPGSALGDGKYETYLRVAKCRQDGSATKYVAKLIYNNNLGVYEDSYLFGQLSPDEKTFIQFDITTEKNKFPAWMRNYE